MRLRNNYIDRILIDYLVEVEGRVTAVVLLVDRKAIATSFVPQAGRIAADDLKSRFAEV